VAKNTSYVDALAAKYYGQIVASAPKAPSISAPAVSAAPSWQPLKPSPTPTTSGNGTPEGGFWARQLDESRPIGKILDILSQPMYKLTESVADIGTSVAEGEGVGEAFAQSLNPLSNWGSENSKISISDLLADRAAEKYYDTRESTANSDNVRTNQGAAFFKQFSPDWMESEERTPDTPWHQDPAFYRNVGRGAVGFAADVIGDPLTYIPGGAIKTVVGGAANAAGRTAVKGINTAAKAAEEAGKTGTFAQKLSEDIPVVRDRMRAIKEQVGSVLPKALRKPVAERMAEMDGPAPTSAVGNAAEAAVDHEITTRQNIAEEAAQSLDPAGTATPARVADETPVTSPDPGQPADLGASGARWVPVAAPAPTVPQRAADALTEAPKPVKPKIPLYRNTDTGEELTYQDLRKRLAEENKQAPPKYVDEIADIYRKVETPVETEVKGPATPAKDLPDFIFQTTRVSGRKEGFENYRPQVESLHQAVKRAARDNKSLMGLAKLSTEQFIAAGLKGMRATGDNRTRLEARAAEILEQAFAKIYQPVSPTLPTENLAARMAQQEVESRSMVTSLQRLTGADLITWIQEQSKFLDSDDLVALLNASSRKQFTDRRNKIQKKKRIKTVQSVQEDGTWQKVQAEMTQMPEVAKQIDETVSSPDGLTEFEAVRAAAAAGENLDEVTRDALSETGSLQQWDLEDPTGEFNKITKTQKTRRNAAKPGEGRGINREGATRHYQRVLFGNIIKRSAEELSSRGLSGKERSLAMMELAMPRMRAAEEFLEANSVFVHAGSTKAGIPIRLTQMLDAISSTTAGKNWVLRKVFSAFDSKPNTNRFDVRKSFEGVPISKDDLAKQIAAEKANAVADVDGILRYGEAVVERVNEYRNAGLELDEAIGRVLEDFTEGSDKTLLSIADALFNAEIVNGKKVYRPAANRLGADGRKLYRDVPAVKQRADELGQEVPEQPSGFVLDAFSVLGREETLKGILQNAYDNAARAGIAFGRDVAEISNETLANVLETLDNPNISLSEKVKVITDTSAVTKRIAKEVRAQRKQEGKSPLGVNGKTEAVEEAADIDVKAKVTEVVPEVDVATARNMDKITKATDETPVEQVPEKVNEPNQTIHNEQVEASIKEMPLAGVLNPDDVADVALQTGIARALDWGMRTFANHYGNVTFHTAMQLSGSVSGVMARALRHKLKNADNMAKSLASRREMTVRAVWKEAFEAIQKGADDAVDPEVRDFTDLVRQTLDPIFDVSREDGTESILGLWAREGFDLQHIENKLRSARYDLPENVSVKMTAKQRKQVMTNRQFSEIWKDWIIDDPLDFIAKMHTISTELATETSISREFFRIGQASGLVSKSPRPGFVKVPRSYQPEKGKKSYVARYLPADKTGHTYMHPDAFREMRRMDSLFQGTYERGGKLDSFMRNNVDPILSMWKSGMTIWRPGHHVRTFMGDVGMAYLMSGVKDPKYYLRALKVAASKKATESGSSTFRGEYGEWDAMRALQGLSEDLDIQKFKTHNKGLAEELARLGGVSGNYSGSIAKTTVGNKVYDIDMKTAWRALMDRGVLPDFRKQEDIVEVEGGWAQKVQKRAEITGGRARTKLGNFTEGRDDTIRIAHALHLLENGLDNNGWAKGMSLNDVFDEVAARLRKAHPDGTDLTPTEQKVMRRLFPFYSWTRKAIPLVLESMVMHPGRFMAYPKAMYNFGASQGVDLESVSDPFPDNQLFPEFLTDQMTGVGFKANDAYYTFSLGQPQADIFKEFFAGSTSGEGGLGDLAQGFGQGTVGMLNPGLSAPIEILSGRDLATGAEIRDNAEAIEQTIPGVNALSSITGVSPLGSISTLLAGEGLDPLAQVERGNREQFDPQYLANYLTGMQFTNASRPNYINLAEIEQRNRIARQQQEG
jgi:hypothetical protein